MTLWEHLKEWWEERNQKPEKFDAFYVQVPGVYPLARIEQTELCETSVHSSQMVRCSVRLQPDSEDDLSKTWVYLSPMLYVKLLQTLGLARTNEHKILVGKTVPTVVKMHFSPFGSYMGNRSEFQGVHDAYK